MSRVFGGGCRGGARPPLFLDQKEAPRAEKFFYGTGPPRYLRVWTTGPPLLSEGLDLLLVLLGKNEKWRLCLNRVKPLFEVVAACRPNLRTYLSWSLKNVPLRAELRCIGHYREYTPGFRRKRRKNYTLSLDGLSPHSWLGNHTGKKKHTREESRFLFKFFDVHTTLVKTLGTLTQQLVKMTHFFSPPVQCWRYGFVSFSTQSTLLRGGVQQKQALSTTFPSIYNR